jgi:Helix-turn-helix
MSMSIEPNIGLEHLGFFSERLLHSMAALKLSPKKLAALIGCSYEYVRRMTRSESLPSPFLMKRMCSVFQWREKKIERLIRLDHCRRKYGRHFWNVLGIHPRMKVVYILFPYLTPQQRQIFVDIARAQVANRLSDDESETPT